MKFGTMMRKQRDLQRLSQIELAEALGVSQSTYCNWESDRSAPRSRYFSKLIQLLHIDPTELIPEAAPIRDVPSEDAHLRQEIHHYQLLVTLLERDVENYQQIIKQLTEENQQLRQTPPKV